MLFFLYVINLYQRTQDGNLRNNYLNDDKAHKILHSKAVKQSCSREVMPFNIYSRKEKNLKYNVTKVDVSNNQTRRENSMNKTEKGKGMISTQNGY